MPARFTLGRHRVVCEGAVVAWMLNGLQSDEIEQVKSAAVSSDQLLVNLIHKLTSVTDKLDSLEERVQQIEMSLTRRS